MTNRDVKWVTMLPKEVESLFKPSGNYCALVKNTNYAELVELAIDFPQGFEAKVQGTEHLKTENNFRRTLTRFNEKLRKAFKTGDTSLPFPVKIDAPESQWKKYRFMKLIAEGITRDELIRILEQDAEKRRKSRGRQKKEAEGSKSDDTIRHYLDSLSTYLDSKLKAIHYIPRRLKLIQADKVSTSQPIEEEEELLTEEQLLAQEDHILIIAESGMGKSTLLAKLALLATEDDRIPVYVDLRAASPERPEDFIGRIYSDAKSYQSKISIEITDEELKDQKLLVLFDHLDMTYTEDPQKPPSEVVNINTLLIKKFAKNVKIIVCCRVNYDNYYSRLSSVFKHYELQDLDINIDVPKLLVDLGVNNIPSHLLDFATNPLRLKMLAEIFTSESNAGKKPEIKRETDIYVEFVNRYLIREASKRHKPQTSPELKKSALAWLAYDSLTFNEREAHELQVPWVIGRLEEIIPKVKERLGLDYLRGDAIKEILEEGLITLSPDRNRYEFYHPSLREFFCAWHLAKSLEEKKAIEIIYPRLGDQTKNIDLDWMGIIRFYVGLIEDATLLLKMVVDEEQMRESIFYSNLRLAGILLSEARYIKDKTVCDRIIAQIIEVYLNAEYELLRGLFLAVIRSIKNETMVDKFIERLSSKSKQIQYRAIIALGELAYDKAVDSLIEMLKTEDKKLKLESVISLGKIRSDKAVESLMQMLEIKYIYQLEIRLQDDINYKLNSAVRDTLVKIASEKTIKLLLESLNHKDEDVQNAAISILGRIGSEEAIEPLAKLWKVKDKNSSFYLTIPDALGNIGSDKAIEVLINFLNDDSAHTISALGRIGSKKAIKPLEPLLKDEDKYRRFSAAVSLKQLGSEKAIPILENFLDSDDQILQLSAAKELGLIGSKKAIALLVGWLEDESPHTSTISEILEEIGTKEVADSLANLLEEKESQQQVSYSSGRGKAIRILARLGDNRAVEPLTKMMKNISRDDVIRQINIIESLSQINSPKAIKSLTNMLEDGELQIHAAWALARMGSDRANDLLIKLLKKMNEVTDSIASYSLGLVGTEEAIEPIVEHFSNRLKLFRNIKSKAGEMLISESYKDLYRLSLRVGIKITKDMVKS